MVLDWHMLMPMQSVNVTVPSSTGLNMAATIDFPSAPPRAFAVFAHCFAGSRHTPGASRVSKRLTEHQIATLRFDFPGLGQSEGDFADTSFSQNVEDIEAACAWLSENYAAPQLLMGHSLGGAAALKAATQLPQLRAVATIGAPFDPAHSVLHYADKIGEVDVNGAVPVTLGGRELVISRGFLEDLAETNPELYLPRIRKPLMLVHSPIDHTVGIDNAQTIFSVTRYPKSLVALDKADHLVTRQGAAVRAADVIGDWVQQYLVPDHTPEKLSPGQVETRVARGVKLGTVARSFFGELETDRPKTDGGRDRGHSALDLFMMSLSAATTEAIQEAAAKQRLTLADVRVRMAHVHDVTFERRIDIDAELTDEQRAGLMAAAKTSVVEKIAGHANIMDVG